MADVVRLVGLRDEPLRVDEVQEAVAEAGAGGCCLFVGTVRDRDAGKDVIGLEYQAHPSALNRLRAVAGGVCTAYPVRALAIVHRVGVLEVGEIAVVAGVACPHRGEAFEACRLLVDQMKLQVPIWKHQLFRDGTQEWVGTP